MQCNIDHGSFVRTFDLLLYKYLFSSKVRQISVQFPHGGTPLLWNSSGGVPPLGLRTMFDPSIKPPSCSLPKLSLTLCQKLSQITHTILQKRSNSTISWVKTQISIDKSTSNSSRSISFIHCQNWSLLDNEYTKKSRYIRRKFPPGHKKFSFVADMTSRPRATSAPQSPQPSSKPASS